MPKAEPAVLFAALGDPTRLRLLDRLGDGAPRSIAKLGDGLPISRQALTKHLQVLARAGLTSVARDGRESLYRIDPPVCSPLRHGSATSRDSGTVRSTD